MNILVTGSNGQLGSEIAALQPDFKQFQFFFTDIHELDITSFMAVEDFVIKNNINALINCAAYTNVDGAEDAQEVADKINNKAVKSLGEISKKHQLKLVHISTDYVFNGISSVPYIETDTTNPQNVYGVTKLKGEEALKLLQIPNAYIIRTSWLYSKYGNNFVKTILRLSNEKSEVKVVNDQIGSPTYAKDLALVILQIIPIIQTSTVEIFHYANKGGCSWFEFAKEIVAVSKHDCKVISVDSSYFPTKATRPKFSLLNTDKIQKIVDLKIPKWQESLKNCIKNMNV